MFRYDRDSFGGGLCIYVNESVPVKQLNSRKDDSESLFLEINLRLSKWVMVGACKPPDQSKFVFLESFSKSLSIYLDIRKGNIIRRFQYDSKRQKLATFCRLF